MCVVFLYHRSNGSIDLIPVESQQKLHTIKQSDAAAKEEAYMSLEALLTHRIDDEMLIFPFMTDWDVTSLFASFSKFAEGGDAVRRSTGRARHVTC